MQQEVAPITELLRLVSQGDPTAEARLIEALYSELRKLAAACMRNERSDHTLQPTALVNEAYLRLVEQRGKEWQSRGHFLGVAAQVMRRVLVDYARAKKSHKRAGQAIRLTLEENFLPSIKPWEDHVIDIDTALNKLSTFDPRQARIIELRYFAGMTDCEIADVVGVSERTVKRDCKAGRAWLHGELQPVGDAPAPAGRSAVASVKTGGT